MQKHTDDARVTTGSGNVFADIGVPDPELAQAKAGVCHKIYSTIKARKLTQVEAAKLMGVDQPKVSEIVRGRVRSYTLDRLVGYLNRLGYGVRIDFVGLPGATVNIRDLVKSKPSSRAAAGVKIVHVRAATGSKKRKGILSPP
jgi:predicted XRE-type DNA-binding protein